MPKLRFYARGTAQVTDVAAQERGIRRCVGRRWQEVVPGRWAWVPTGEPQAVEYHPDYVKAVREGDLWPADEETAKACRVPFDPKFDDETTETIKEFKAKKAAAAEAAKSADKPGDKPADKPGQKPGGKGDV